MSITNKPECFYAPLELVNVAVCGCGREHTHTDDAPKVTEAGAWFHCECTSTLLSPVKVTGRSVHLAAPVQCPCGVTHVETGSSFQVIDKGVWFKCGCGEQLFLSIKRGRECVKRLPPRG